MVHARASYGFAQHVGDISSVATAAAALTVKKFYFDITTGVDAASNTVRVLITHLQSPQVAQPTRCVCETSRKAHLRVLPSALLRAKPPAGV